jgi:pimeloyl-ACP methyl ester carboxylesterase
MTQTTRPFDKSNSPAIDEGRFVNIHGLEQWVTLRGTHVDNPVLLIIPGPGAGMSGLAPFFAPWQEYFTLAQWEQPRAGVTYARHGAAVGEYNIERLVRDGLGVVEFIHTRLGAPQVVPLAFSGGTIVALNMLKRRPELFTAYVGTGQIVNWGRQDALSYTLVLEAARAAGDSTAIADLERIGPPPYPDTATDAAKSKYSGAYSPAEGRAFATLDPSVMAAVITPPADAKYLPPGLVLEKDVRAVATAAYDALRNEIVTFDAERLGLDFEMPMLFIQGEQDLLTVGMEVRAYADKIRAPAKAYVPLEGGGHSPWMMRDAFLQALVTHLLPILALP